MAAIACPWRGSKPAWQKVYLNASQISAGALGISAPVPSNPFISLFPPVRRIWDISEKTTMLCTKPHLAVEKQLLKFKGNSVRFGIHMPNEPWNLE